MKNSYSSLCGFESMEEVPELKPALSCLVYVVKVGRIIVVIKYPQLSSVIKTEIHYR